MGEKKGRCKTLNNTHHSATYRFSSTG